MDKKTLEPTYDLAFLQGLTAVCGGAVEEDACGPQWWSGDRAQASISTWRKGVVCPLPDLGLIQVEGPEAARFLQSQLTNEVEKQGADQLALNGYCTAKGRLLASAYQWVDTERVNLIVSRPLAAPLAKRLSMFVLRAKAKVHDRSANHICLGLAGASIDPALAALGLNQPAPGTVTRGADGSIALGLEAVVVDEQPIACVLLALPLDHLSAVWPGLTTQLQPLSSAHWRWAEIVSGRPRITPRTSELFVPQMVNLDLVGGVSFKKGCYPGQEVVARSHYLGKLKRRMFGGMIAAPVAESASSLVAASGPAAGGSVASESASGVTVASGPADGIRPRAHPGGLPSPGDDVLAASTGEPCGEVVLAAHAPDGGIVLLFESQIAEASTARLGGVAGRQSAEASDAGLSRRVLEPLPLPYPVPCA